MANKQQLSLNAFRCPWVLLLVWLVLGSACQPNDQPAGAETRFAIALGEQVVSVQLALGSRESARGLMGRTYLDEDEGMLFVFAQPRQQSFWMKNTPLPLDIGFFCAEGILREVRQMVPFDETAVVSSRDDIQFALEMNRGWFAARRVLPGAGMDIAAVRRAVRARGQDPAQVMGTAGR